jgi:hypothetical protein
VKQVFFFLVATMVAVTGAADVFTYDVQMAGYRFDKVDEKGEIGFNEFVAEFSSFPWMEQVGRANGGSEATLAVRNKTNGTDLWVSIAGSPSDHAFIVGLTSPQEKKSLFGLSSRKVRWLEMYLVPKSSTVEDLFSTFFNSEHEQLRLKLEKLEKFDEMEAKN